MKEIKVKGNSCGGTNYFNRVYKHYDEDGITEFKMIVLIGDNQQGVHDGILEQYARLYRVHGRLPFVVQVTMEQEPTRDEMLRKRGYKPLMEHHEANPEVKDMYHVQLLNHVLLAEIDYSDLEHGDDNLIWITDAVYQTYVPNMS